jgi:hypothetical protein
MMPLWADRKGGRDCGFGQMYILRLCSLNSLVVSFLNGRMVLIG